MKYLVKIIFLVIFFIPLYAEEPDFPNNCPSDYLVNLNSSINGRIDPNYDIDIIKINVTESGTLTLYTSWPTNDKVDTYGVLLDNNCNVITYDDNSGYDYNFYIQKFVQPGTYYIKVSSNNWWWWWWGNMGIGDYILHVEFYTGESYSQNNPRDFEIEYQANINGTLKVIGNHNICYKHSSNDVCRDPGSSATNNSVYQYFANVDLDASSFLNSSMARLTLNPNDEIVWAGLYWQARIRTSNPNNDNRVSNANKVKFKTPTSNGYVDINCKDGKFNWYYDPGDDVWDYACMAEVTDLVKESGNYYVANLQASEGYNKGAGWALVIVVKNDNEKFKNITVYDGLIGVYNYHTDIYESSVSSTLTDFYTPQSGDVEANFIFFANESDNGLEDEITITDSNNQPENLENDINPANNVINGTISRNGTYVTDRNPNFNNTLGTDIDEFDISNILDNSQTETTITVTSKGDRIFLSMYGISIQLYQPKICYIETLYDSNGNEINGSSQIQVGDMIRAHLLIRNDDNETAKYVQIIKNFDENITKYEQNSSCVKDVEDNELICYPDNSGPVTYDDINKTLTIGYLGEGNPPLFKPYSLDSNHIAYIDYNMTIQTDQPFSLSYETSYEFEIAGQKFEVNTTLPKCIDFNNTIIPYRPALGTYNVVNENFSGNSDPTDTNSSINSLYTQIVNKPFDVKVLHLGDDKTTLENTTGVVFLDIVDATNIKDENSCKNASKIYAISGKDFPIYFGDKNSQTSIQNVNNITIPIANKNLTFRVKYMDWAEVIHNSGVTCADVSNMSANLKGVPACLDSGNKIEQVFPGNPCRDSSTGAPCLPQNHGVGNGPYDHEYGCAQCLIDFNPYYVCARDNFSVRPDKYSMDTNETVLIGAKPYYLDINATQYNNDLNSTGYNQIINNSADKNITAKLVLPSGCTLSSNISPSPISSIQFTDGKAENIIFKYNNVGDVNLTIIDNDWTKVDQQPKSDNSIDCIAGSDTNVSVNGKIGCLTKGNQIFIFNPKTFDNNVTLQNFNNGNYTYISDDGNMSADLKLEIKAVLDDNSIATNYTAGCFAKDINYTISLINNKTLTWSTAQNRIRYFDDAISSDLISTNTNPSIFKSNEGNFTSGIANLKIRFNFDRNASIADNPFIISKNDFNLTVKEINGTTVGNDFDRTFDQNASFYYARVHSPDYKTVGNSFNANIYFEVYDQNLSDPAGILGSNPKESVDDVFWYINPQHTTLSGQIFNIISKHGKVNTTLSSSVSDGIEKWNHTYTGSNYPYKDRMDINASSWLIYNRFDENAKTNHYYIEFTKTGDWAGIGERGKVVDINISKENEKRIEW